MMSQSLRLSSFSIFTTVTLFSAIATIQSPASAATLLPVDLELSLLVDVSPSVSAPEYDLQIGGYRDAFINLAPLFDSDEFGTVAINFIQWAGPTKQEESIPWTLVEDGNSALELANAIDEVVRPSGFFGTAPGSAIQFATELFSTNAYDGNYWIIDVSGDGFQNSGISTSAARDSALAAGVTAINGLPILPATFNSGLDDWYEANIQGGEGSFVIAAEGFENFGQAVEQKLNLELSLSASDSPPGSSLAPQAIPETSSVLGLAIVGGVLASFRYRDS